MNRQTRYHSTLLSMSRYLLYIGLCLGLCALAQAAGYPGEQDLQTLNPIGQYTNAGPDISCAKHPGQRTTTLNIRGADVATLWRSAYHMIFPGFSPTDNDKVDRATRVPHKGPTWGVSLNKRTAMMTIQTKW